MLAFLFVSAAAVATVYPGNGKTGFGGPIGLGTLEITNSADSIIFKLVRGTGSVNDALVIYFDSKAGGFSTTALFDDQTDFLTKAIGGYDNTIGPGTGRSVFNFSSTFKPDFALAFRPGLNGKLVALKDANSFTLLETPLLSNNGAASTYTIKIKASDIGLSGCIAFKFIATYISTTAYRSEEAIGDPMTGFVQGWNPYTSTTPPLNYLSCAAPSGLAVTNLTSTSAKLSWSAVSCAIGYQYLIRKKGTTPWVTVQLTGTSKTATGLTPATTYQWKTLTGCRITPDTVSSGYTTGPEFTTAAALTIPGAPAQQLAVRLSPNPAVTTSVLHITGAVGTVAITVTNISGMMVWRYTGKRPDLVEIPVQQLNNGLYHVKVTDDLRSVIVDLVKE